MSKQTRSTLALLGLVAGVCAYAYFGVFKQEQKEADKKSVSMKIFDLSADQIAGLQLKWIGSEATLSKNDKGEWRITSPIQDSADSNEVSTLLKNIDEGSIFAEVSTDPAADLKVFGLDNPMGFMKVTLKDGAVRTLVLSQTEGLGDKRYGQIQETHRIFALEKSTNDLLVKTLKDLRDKRLIRTPISHLTKIAIRDRNQMVAEMVRKESNWSYSGSDWAVDQAQVKGYLNNLENLKAENIASEDKASAESKKQFQTANTTLEVEVAVESEKPEVLSVHSNHDGRVFLTNSSLPTVYQVAAGQIDGLKVKSDFFRDKKKPFEFDKDKIDKIEVRTELTKMELEKKGSDWTEIMGAADSKIDQTQVSRLIDSLKGLSAAEYLGEKKKKDFGQTLGSVVFKTKDGQTEFEIKWGRELSTENRVVLTNRANEALAVSKTSLAALPLQTLKEAKPKAGEVKVKEVTKEESHK